MSVAQSTALSSTSTKDVLTDPEAILQRMRDEVIVYPEAIRSGEQDYDRVVILLHSMFCGPHQWEDIPKAVED